MPELPEVETTRRGIEPVLLNKTVSGVIIRQRQLRWSIPNEIDNHLPGTTFHAVRRRAKYLLLECDHGTALIHLGMTGTLRILDSETPAEKHDHVDIILASGQILRFRDPRRFGAILWSDGPGEQHPLLAPLGIEPVGSTTVPELTSQLHDMAQGRTVPIKNLIMDQKVVCGVGNIYACEALFLSGIHPQRRCNRISLNRYQTLADAIQRTLNRAIEQGGTTLQDFRNSEGKPGYFQQQLHVYGREGEPCLHCETPIRRVQQSQRSTWYCTSCEH